MAEYGVLLVGGSRTHQESHARVFAAHPKCRLVAVTDEEGVSEYRADLDRRLAREHGIPYVATLEDALRLDVQIVSSTPEVERRGRVAVRCMEAGKHVYLDKPLASTIADIDAIVEAADSTGVTAQMFTTIQSHWAQAAKRAVMEGAVGDLQAVHIENLFAKGRAGTVPDGVVRQERESMGQVTFVEAKREMFDVSIYCIALAHWLTGRRAESVYCQTGNYFHAQHARVDVEDFGAMAIRMTGGLTATIVSGRFGWTSHPQNGPQRIILIGTEGSLTFDAYRPRVEIYNDDPDHTHPPLHLGDPMAMWGSTAVENPPVPKKRWASFDQADAMVTDVAAFIDCIETGRKPEIDPHVAAASTEVILGGYASAARKEEVTLPLPRG